MNNEELYQNSIILIGPSGAGKSTIADILSKRTNMPRLCLDVIANRWRRDRGLMGRFHNPDEFYYCLIHKTLGQLNTSGICNFGAGHSIYRDPRIFDKVKKELEPFENIILLLPSGDVKESLEIVNARTTSKSGVKENLEFLKSPCNEELATIIVFTNNKTPDEISTEILEMIDEKKRSICK